MFQMTLKCDRTMSNVLQCPKCGATELESRNHEQGLKTVGGILMTSAGATAGTVGGAATGASTGAAIGTIAGPLGVILGGTIGTFVGAIAVGITGGVLGNMLGKKAGIMVDRNIFQDFRCKACKHRFKAESPQEDKAHS
jgi:phage tail tape-measure protein